MIHAMIGCDIDLAGGVEGVDAVDPAIDCLDLLDRFRFTRRVMVEDAIVGGAIDQVGVVHLDTTAGGFDDPFAALHALDGRRRIEPYRASKERSGFCALIA